MILIQAADPFRFVQPVEFQEAVTKLGTKTPVAVALSSQQWADAPVAIRERAFFSAQVANAQFLQRAQNLMLDFLHNTRETLPNGQTKLAVGGRGEFIKKMQIFMDQEGIPRQGRQGSIKDIGSNQRLKLIFDTNIKSVQEYGYWRQGLDPKILAMFPAQRFIRVVRVLSPRPLHEQNTNEVRRKDDFAFWLAMNSPEIGGFGVPWGPWGFNSGMDVEDVDRAEAESLGLVEPGETLASPLVPLNQHLEASVKGVQDELIRKLQEKVPQLRRQGDQVALEPSPQATPQAPTTAPESAPAPKAPEPTPEAPQAKPVPTVEPVVPVVKVVPVPAIPPEKFAAIEKAGPVVRVTEKATGQQATEIPVGIVQTAPNGFAWLGDRPDRPDNVRQVVGAVAIGEALIQLENETSLVELTSMAEHFTGDPGGLRSARRLLQKRLAQLFRVRPNWLRATKALLRTLAGLTN